MTALGSIPITENTFLFTITYYFQIPKVLVKSEEWRVKNEEWKSNPQGQVLGDLVAGMGFEPHDLRVMSPTS